jgi:hypothetical protein
MAPFGPTSTVNSRAGLSLCPPVVDVVSARQTTAPLRPTIARPIHPGISAAIVTWHGCRETAHGGSDAKTASTAPSWRRSSTHHPHVQGHHDTATRTGQPPSLLIHWRLCMQAQSHCLLLVRCATACLPDCSLFVAHSAKSDRGSSRTGRVCGWLTAARRSQAHKRLLHLLINQ